MSSQGNRFQKERAQKMLLELASMPGNNICADCKARLPRWASWNLGIFICQNCASIHRKIGTHITKVKSLTMDDWTKEQIEFMQSKGNVKSNAIYNPNEIRNPPPPNLEDTERDSEIEQYIRAKYEYRKFIDRSALVASQLGPSRSASSIPPRTAPTSTPNAPSSSQASSAPPRSSGFITSRVPVDLLAQQVPQLPPRPTENTSRSVPTTSRTLPADFGQGNNNSSNNPLDHSIWADLSSLNTPAQNSTLPLQYQQPGAGGMGSSSGLVSAPGMNPYARDVYSQQPAMQASSSFGNSLNMPSGIPQTQSYNPYPGTSPSNSTMLSQSPSAGFFQPQATQATLQPQAPATHNFLSPSPGQSFMSNSPGQQQFLSSSPSQHFLSQPQMQMSPQLPGQAQAQFQFQNSTSIPSQNQFAMNPQSSPAQGQFLGMTTMQMQQQALLMQQQQQQQQQQLQMQQLQQLQQRQQLQQLQQQQQMQQQMSPGMYGSGQPQMGFGQTFPQGGYPSQGAHQWGAM